MPTKILSLFLTLCFIFALPLHAYTDPGTGAMIWQLLMACFVGLMFYIRQIIDCVKSLFSKKSEAETDA